MKRLGMSVLLAFFVDYAVVARQPELTDYQEFKSYPYMEKAYRLEKQGNYQAALEEVEKALEVAPHHQPFVQFRVQLQLSSMSTSELMTMFLNAPQAQQTEIAEPLLAVLLGLEDGVSIEQYAVVLNQIPTSKKENATERINARLIGQGRLKETLELLNSMDSFSPDLIAQRFILASELNQHQLVVTLYPQLDSLLDSQNLSRYIEALMALDRHEEALAALSKDSTIGNRPSLFDNFIQRQIGNRNYQLAEQAFRFLETQNLLTASQKQQWLRMRLASTELQLEINDVLQSDLACWQQAEILKTRLGDKGKQSATKLLLDCNVGANEQDQYVTVALSMLSIEQLKQVVNKVPRSRQLQLLQEGIVNKLISAEDYEQIIRLASTKGYESAVSLSTLAFAYQQTDNLDAAADTYWQLYQRTGSINALDQATFLWAALGKNTKVQDVLLVPLSAKNPTLPTSLVLRYIDALDSEQQLSESIVKNLYLRKAGIDAVAEKLRVQQNCQQSIAYIRHFNLNSYASRMTQALCLQQLGDDRSITAWLQILEDSPSLENFKASLFAMINASQYSDVLALINKYSQFRSDSEVADIKLQALIQTRNYDEALNEWKQQVRESDSQYLMSGIELAVQTEQYDYANELTNQLVSSNSALSESDWTTVAQVKTLVNKPNEALAAWKIVFEQNPNSTVALLNIAYATIPVSPKKALEMFRQYSYKTTSVDSNVWNQMAFLADTLGEYSSVAEYLDNYFSTLQVDYAVDTQRSWSLHNLYQQSHRRWNFIATASHGNGAVLGDVFFIDNDGNLDENLPNNGLSARLSYRLFEDSKRWNAYTQVNANGPDSSPLGQQSIELGVSYRLLENINLLASTGVIYFSDGDEQFQPFIRLSGDFLNQGEWRNGWRFDNSWWERQWYNDILYLPDNKQIFAISRFDGGYVKPLATETKQTIKVYGLLQYDYRKQPISDTALAGFDQVSIGIGIQWRLFESPNNKNDAASTWSANLEVRNKFSGDLTNDDTGLFFSLGYQY